MTIREDQLLARGRRKARSRGRVHGTAARPRMSVYRTDKHIYAQLVDDDAGVTLAAASTLSPELKARGGYGGNADAAKAVGGLVASKAIAANISKVVFDRNGFLYHGRVKALADGAREAGLDF